MNLSFASSTVSVKHGGSVTEPALSGEVTGAGAGTITYAFGQYDGGDSKCEYRQVGD